MEFHQGQFGAIVGGGESVGFAETLMPDTGQTCGLMDMAMQGDKGLAILDKAPDSDTADMGIERGIIDKFTLERGEIEFGIVGRRVEEKNGMAEIIAIGELVRSSAIVE